MHSTVHFPGLSTAQQNAIFFQIKEQALTVMTVEEQKAFVYQYFQEPSKTSHLEKKPLPKKKQHTAIAGDFASVFPGQVPSWATSELEEGELPQSGPARSSGGRGARGRPYQGSY